MAGNSLSEQTKAVANYVDKKIRILQIGYTGSNSRARARAMASLARLRRLGTSAYSPWMTIGEEIFTGWPEDTLGVADESSYSVKAVKAGLQLYAYHQQSKPTPVDALIDGDSVQIRQQQRRHAAFAAVCRRINPDLDSSHGVQRRLASVEAASDFDRAVGHIRSLIFLIKSSRQSSPQNSQIDYRTLVEDLYRMQFASQKQSVFQRWGRAYYAFEPGQKSNKDDSVQ